MDLNLLWAMGKLRATAPLKLATETEGPHGATGFWLAPGQELTIAAVPASAEVEVTVMSRGSGALVVNWHTPPIPYFRNPSRLLTWWRLERVGIPRPGVLSTVTLTAEREPVFVGNGRITDRAPAPIGGPSRLLLLVSCDTLRADTLSSYGDAACLTPHLDRLARAGLQAERAFANAPWTLPSHMTLLTGLYPGEHRVTPSRALPAASPTLAEKLRARGWDAAGFATKVGWLDAVFGFARGFEPYLLCWDDARGAIDRALSWLDLPRSKPAFVFLHLYDAHSDAAAPRIYDAPPPFAALLQPALPAIARRHVETPGSAALQKENEKLQAGKVISDADLSEIHGVYREGVMALDYELGRMLASLAARGLRDRAQLIVTADHGEELAEHGRLLHDQLYDEVTQVPLLVLGIGKPGLQPEPLELAEVAPAIEQVADGKTWPIPVSGPKYGFGPGATRSLRDGPWLLISELGKGPLALYDLEHDARALLNVLPIRADVASRLQKVLGARLAENDRRYKAVTEGRAPTATGAVSTPREGEVPAISDEERERLRSLGYHN